MKLEPKKAKESLVVKNELLMPNDTNMFNNLMGGKMMYWMDICAGISAQKHSGSLAVTASVDNISFNQPIELGSLVTLTGQVTRSFNSSMEVFIQVIAENFQNLAELCVLAIGLQEMKKTQQEPELTL